MVKRWITRCARDWCRTSKIDTPDYLHDSGMHLIRRTCPINDLHSTGIPAGQLKEDVPDTTVKIERP